MKTEDRESLPIMVPGQAGDLHLLLKVCYEDLHELREQKSTDQARVVAIAQTLLRALAMWLGIIPVAEWPPPKGDATGSRMNW